ncbi:hypothetical protein TRICI_002897 [Trichomonascus ciferrii]|uniref:Uncharacterized protein n=1 Tax=Trichomonascus ciferrii TaxID=44093 RepID=A0A642VBG0_9ASCO|nr:hypothetical protein TRICI_002897 [Trichomonascus ciferrii]
MRRRIEEDVIAMEGMPAELLLVLCLYLTGPKGISIAVTYRYLEELLTYNDWKYLFLSVYHGGDVREGRRMEMYDRDRVQRLSEYLLTAYRFNRSFSLITRLCLPGDNDDDGLANLHAILETLSLDENANQSKLSRFMSFSIFHKVNQTFEVVIDRISVLPQLHNDPAKKYMMTWGLTNLTLISDLHKGGADLNYLLRQAPLTAKYPHVTWMTVRNWTDQITLLSSYLDARGGFSTVVLRRFFKSFPNVVSLILEGPFIHEQNRPIRFLPKSVIRLILLMPFNTTNWMYRESRRSNKGKHLPVYFTHRDTGFHLYLRGDIHKTVKFLSTYHFHPAWKLSLNPTIPYLPLYTNETTLLLRLLQPTFLTMQNYQSRDIYPVTRVVSDVVQVLVIKGPWAINMASDATMIHSYNMFFPNIKYIVLEENEPIGFQWHIIFRTFADYFPQLRRIFCGRYTLEPYECAEYYTGRPTGYFAVEWAYLACGIRVASCIDIEKFRQIQPPQQRTWSTEQTITIGGQEYPLQTSVVNVEGARNNDRQTEFEKMVDDITDDDNDIYVDDMYDSSDDPLPARRTPLCIPPDSQYCPYYYYTSSSSSRHSSSRSPQILEEIPEQDESSDFDMPDYS